MLVNVLISVGQFQRDLQNELTREGLVAAWAGGARSGGRPQIATNGDLDKVRQQYRDPVQVTAHPAWSTRLVEVTHRVDVHPV